MTLLRSALRAGTAACHATLDQQFAALDVRHLPDYIQLLKAQHPALRAIELSLEAAGVDSILPDWPQRRRRHALEADLAALDAASRLSGVLVEAPLIRGRAQALGHLYVLEGSRLGAEVLLRRVLASDDPRLSQATRFLAHGRGRPFWRDFVDLLNTERADGAFKAEAVTAAVASFGLFQKVAEQILSHYLVGHDRRRAAKK
ncbi:biliverdin-producing heme oxygenase [Nitrospirillum sp. BR 11163]|uniref:biliverdin-producing heme oxygenase n=1 Tax=Nitrospirillum sp. BR 11163 TaxID=3104323 RepID=UPI002AFDD597|nr:biliverdin-producing heme oxygenase [Nitrospirillum sp. BR 11163]MEA1673541.1 biliverdin-producing heme oxygenase [Nitrospirillum sp. BR 11163]